MTTAHLTVTLLLVSQCAIAAASQLLGNSNLKVRIAIGERAEVVFGR